MTTAAAVESDPLPESDELLVVLVGGPYDGHWYTEDDWNRMRAAALYRAEWHLSPTSPWLDYELSREQLRHPFLPDRSGRAWKHHSLQPRLS